jgi:CubicO group peptidase (beta-lactamase class C family)
VTRTVAGLLAFLIAFGFAQPVPFERLDDHVQGEMRRVQIPGLAYAVVQDGEVVHLRAFGVAGPDGRALSARTVMNTASLGKTFTALAVRQLVDAGRLQLDAPVRSYLPWFTLADEGATHITVRHLLEHTSGLSNADGNRPHLYRPGPTGADLVRTMSSLRIDRPVGERYEYSNLNYLVLGEVVAAASGQTYEAYVQEHVFDRLGMAQTFFSAEDARAAGLDVADGYRLAFGMPVVANIPLPRGAMAAGLVFTTIEDMARYAAAFSNHGLLDGVSAVTADGAATGERRTYDMTWQPVRNADRDYGTGFSGGWLTYSSGLEILPNRRFAVVILSNANTWQAFGTTTTFDIGFDVMRLHHGWPLPASKPSPWRYYLAADAVLLVLCAVVVGRALHLRGWPRRTRTNRSGHWAHLPWLVGEIVVPLAVLILFPQHTTGLAVPWEGWARFVFSVPDLGYALLVLCLGLLAVGLVRLGRTLGRPATGRPHIESPLLGGSAT